MSFGEIAKITDSRYELATLVSNRAREIVDGD
ncbi:DNA-directed RNA polymerase subunit omega, partial [Aedoeadaptatus coxii]